MSDMSSSASGLFHHARDCRHDAFVLGRSRLELLSPATSDRVVTRVPSRGRLSPFGGDPSLAQQAVERRVERPLLDAENVIRERLDVTRHRVPVGASQSEGTQDEHVERAGEQVAANGGVWHRQMPWYEDVYLSRPSSPSPHSRTPNRSAELSSDPLALPGAPEQRRPTTTSTPPLRPPTLRSRDPAGPRP